MKKLNKKLLIQQIDKKLIRLSALKDLAIPPAIPAIIRDMRMSIILNNYLLNKHKYKVILIKIIINFKKLSFL